MREIKFRVWDKEYSSMNNIDYWDFRGKSLDFGTDVASTPDDFETIEIMQYTGLKDKNGKEIYEGDIIKQSKFSGYFPMQGEYEIEKVIYENCCFCIKVMKDVLSNFKIMTDNCEVIGNIYENPELLQ